MTRNIADYGQTLKSIEGIETCLNNMYTTQSNDSFMSDIIGFTKANLDIVEAFINEKRDELVDPDRFGPYTGKELVYEYWMFLRARLSSMNDNLNYNLEFPNIYDYLNEYNR